MDNPQDNPAANAGQTAGDGGKEGEGEGVAAAPPAGYGLQESSEYSEESVKEESDLGGEKMIAQFNKEQKQLGLDIKDLNTQLKELVAQEEREHQET